MIPDATCPRLRSTDLLALAERQQLSGAEQLDVVKLFMSASEDEKRRALIAVRRNKSIHISQPTLDPIIAALRTLIRDDYRHLSGRHRLAAIETDRNPGSLPRLVLEEARTLSLNSGELAPLRAVEALIQPLESAGLSTAMATEFYRRVTVYGADFCGMYRRADNSVVKWIDSTLDRRDEVSSEASCDILAMSLEAYARASAFSGKLDVARNHLSQLECLQKLNPSPPDCLAQLELEMATALDLEKHPLEAAARFRSGLSRLRNLPSDVNEPLRLRLHLGYSRVELEYLMEGLWLALADAQDHRVLIQATRHFAALAEPNAEYRIGRELFVGCWWWIVGMKPSA